MVMVLCLFCYSTLFILLGCLSLLHTIFLHQPLKIEFFLIVNAIFMYKSNSVQEFHLIDPRTPHLNSFSYHFFSEHIQFNLKIYPTIAVFGLIISEFLALLYKKNPIAL